MVVPEGKGPPLRKCLPLNGCLPPTQQFTVLPLHFYRNFRVTLSISTKLPPQILTGVALNQWVLLEENWHLNDTASSPS